MPRQQQTQTFRHNRFENVALAYITNISPTDVRPHWALGSNNVLTGIDGVAMRRPGTLLDPADAMQFLTADIKRYFYWAKASTDVYYFVSVVSAGTSSVYKLRTASESTYVLIHLDSTSSEPFDYVVSHNFVFFSNGTDSKKYDGTTVTNWGIVGPVSAPTASALGGGNIPAHIGHQYAYTYGISTRGYQSDLSPLSAVFVTDDNSATITGAKCLDAQCDEVHVFRTEDGGATLYELSNSPIANPGGSTWSMTDNDADEDLNFSSPAPLRYVNAPAPAMFQPTLFAGRIWGFLGDRVYRSTLEENNTSVPEECFNISPSTPSAYRFGRTVTAIGVAGDYLLVYTQRGIFKIGGDSLATFFRSTLSKNLGAFYRQNLGDFQGDLVWLDTSNTLRITDGETVGKPDLTQPIRLDISQIDHSKAQVLVHDDGLHSWIILMDGSAGLVYVFDVDTKQWMPPWIWPGISAMGSCDATSSRSFIQLARYGRSLQLNAVVSYDMDPYASGSGSSADQQTFGAELRLSLTPLNADNPTGINDLNYVSIERNAHEPIDVAVVMDDDPFQTIYTSIVHNAEDPDLRIPGKNIVEKWYWNNAISPGQRLSVKIVWPNEATEFKMYTLDLVHTPTK